MKVFLAVVLALVAFAQASPSNRLTGGEEAAVLSVPYQAFIKAVTSDEEVICSGSILSGDYILTAASCVYNAIQAEIFLGSVDVNDANAPSSFSTDIRVHYAFNSADKSHDIAILKLQSTAEFSKAVSSVALPTYDDIEENYDQENIKVTGYGKSSNTFDLWSLNIGEAIVTKHSECHEGDLPDDQLCLSKFLGVVLCSGDEGAPMVLRYDDNETQIGIGSQVSEDCNPETSEESVFTRVTTYLDWIHGQTGNTLLPPVNKL